MDESTLLAAGAFVLFTLLILPLIAAISSRGPDPEEQVETEPAE